MHTRRTFFGVTGALGGAALLTGGLAARSAQAASRGGLKIGLASYSMRKLSVDQVIETCKTAGIKYINLKDVHLSRKDPPETVKANADKFRAAGLTILGGGTITMPEKGQEPTEAELRKPFEYAKAAGFPLIVASPAIESLDIVEKLAKEFDIKVAIHNHGPEDKKYPTPQAALKLIAKRDKRMGVCMDIGHTLRAGADPAKTALQCGSRLLDLHVKDIVKNPNGDAEAKADPKAGWTQVNVGLGQMDIVGLFKALQRINFQGHVGLEYEINADNPVQGILASLSYMRGVAAGIGAAERQVG
jgi:sugar phosphate isomerase/epimerase